MRKKIHPKTRVSYIAISITLFFLLILSIFTIPQVLGLPGDELLIQITKDKDPIEEVCEGEFFVVSVLDPNSGEDSPYLRDVFIKFDGGTYHITLENEQAEISIEAPSVYDDTTYIINASKEGYVSTETNITVLNKKLVITLDYYTINVNERFSVLITDESTGDPVEGVAVKIVETDVDVQYTKANGRVTLVAPENAGEITIAAQKQGEYRQVTESIYVNKPSSFWGEIVNNEYFFIVVAAIILVCAIIFVNLRSRKNIYDRSKEITNEKMINKYTPKDDIATKSNDKKEEINLQGFSGAPVRSQPKKDPRVEEIRISRPKIKKEIVKVETEEDKANKVVSEKRIKRKDYDWFEGTDEMRYEINKLTGEIDEEGLDKWFEGVSDLKVKIDEKIKKKDKKKNEEKDES